MHRTIRVGLLAAALAGVFLSPCLSSAGVISATNNTPGNFDASSGNRTVAFTGAEAGFDSGIIEKVTIAINFAKADGQDPNSLGTGTPFHNEIVFRLTSPDGTVVTLIAAGSFNVGDTAFDGTITFDQDALLAVNDNPNTPQAGTFRPTGPGSLNDFIGEMADGTWTLFIQDTVGLDSLRFRSFTLTVNTVLPEPTSMAIFAVAGVAGAVYARRRKAKVA